MDEDGPRRFAPLRTLRAVLAEPTRRGQLLSWALAVVAVLVSAALLYSCFPQPTR